MKVWRDGGRGYRIWLSSFSMDSSFRPSRLNFALSDALL